MNQKPAREPIESHSTDAAVRREYGKLRTTWFDCVTSMLAAVVLFLGTLVFLLAIVWIVAGEPTMRSHPKPYPEVVLGAARSISLQRDFLQPGSEEVVELNEPSVVESLSAVDRAAGRVALSVSNDLSSLLAESGENGRRDARLPGPDAPVDIVPRCQRWQLEFTAGDVQSYARQLDHYGIELGVIGGAIQGVDYAGHLSTKPELRRGASRAEKRLYFMWTRPSRLMQFDRRLLLSAGAKLRGREILKFVPDALENQLARIELEYAMSRGHALPGSIAKTVFSSQSAGDDYQFVVSDQRYRKQND